uniref:Uncharacterized protein n=1 Tax=Rhizophora mucronata TaxID=61149 RepID=A0A2P2PCT6_RHIMU
MRRLGARCFFTICIPKSTLMEKLRSIRA